MKRRRLGRRIRGGVWAYADVPLRSLGLRVVTAPCPCGALFPFSKRALATPRPAASHFVFGLAVLLRSLHSSTRTVCPKSTLRRRRRSLYVIHPHSYSSALVYAPYDTAGVLLGVLSGTRLRVKFRNHLGRISKKDVGPHTGYRAAATEPQGRGFGPAQVQHIRLMRRWVFRQARRGCAPGPCDAAANCSRRACIAGQQKQPQQPPPQQKRS